MIMVFGYGRGYCYRFNRGDILLGKRLKVWVFLLFVVWGFNLYIGIEYVRSRIIVRLIIN